MIKKIKIAVVFFIAICIGWLVVNFIFSHKKIHILLSGKDYNVEIRDTSGKRLHSISTSKSIVLREGTYSYSIAGVGYSSKSTQFTVEHNDQDVKIQPRYLESYLKQTTEKERQPVFSLIRKKYSSLNNIDMIEFSLDDKNIWGYGKIILNDNRNEVYRFIVRRNNDLIWEIYISPRIVISNNDIEDTPKDIIHELY